MAAYSPLDVHATIVGPGGVINLGIGSGLAADGITYTKSEATNTMQIGLDGSVCHNKSESRAGTITFNFLGVSPAQQQMLRMYNLQEGIPGSSMHGKNTITIVNSATGEKLVATECAFQNDSAVGYKKEIDACTWTFDCGQIVHLG